MAQDLVPAGSYYSPAGFAPARKNGWEAVNQLLFVIFKWRRLILWLCLLFPVAVALGLALRPTVRRANGAVMIKGDRIPLQMTGANLAGNSRWAYSAQAMQSEVRLFESRRVLEPVARKLLALPEIEAPPQGLRAWISAALRAVKSAVGLKPPSKTEAEKLDDMIARLRNATTAIPITDTNVIRVSHFAPTAEVAVRNLELILKHYLDEQADMQTGADSLPRYFEQEKRRVEAQLADAERALEKWQASNNAVSMDEQISNGLKLLSHRETALKETEEQLEATLATVAVIDQQLKAMPRRVLVAQERVQNPAVSKLQERLTAAEVTRRELLQRYTDKSRQVQDVNSQIDLLTRELRDAQGKDVIGRETTEINPLHANLERDLAVAQAKLQALSAQKETLRRQIREAAQDLGVLRQNKGEWSRLTRVVNLYTESFAMYGKKLEEARMATGQAREQLAQAMIIAHPSAAPPEGVGDDVMLVLAASLVGVALATAIAFGIEMFNNSMRTQADIEHYLGLPMLAVVPELPLRRLLPPPDAYGEDRE